MPLEVDKEFAAAAAPAKQWLDSQPKMPFGDVQARRDIFGVYTSMIDRTIPDTVEHDILHVTTSDGYQIPVWRYKGKQNKHSPENPGPAVIHMHAGGYICCGPEIAVPNLTQFAAQTDVDFFSVNYRKAPENKFPTASEDCWTVLKWVMDNAQKLGVDKTRVAVMGESAGGGLAAALTIMARDRKLNPPLARQILAYPMLDDRSTDKVPPGTYSIWDEIDTDTAWEAYLGPGKRGADEVSVYAAPGRMDDVTGLPPLYMDVGQLDTFFHDDFKYASKFVAAGIETEFHVYPGLPHAYEGMIRELPVGKQFIDNRMRQLKMI
ncbi:FAD binding domain-containing protein [Pochonia chlamydosporia 170]|uniref:FAD binding domain-containing protein n=1 Tax=Pochonia chlamydosporia 170 TaxID=1380566 RepID=A0A179FIY6_METCM|nr:FAD binding domain-containing protein [Pochonia chlamydosporia 170]OAQ65347.1 FAD binding domain-containing protein [Pochonia chlamydosporia 170]